MIYCASLKLLTYQLNQTLLPLYNHEVRQNAVTVSTDVTKYSRLIYREIAFPFYGKIRN
jgi:hypothetical protein